MKKKRFYKFLSDNNCLEEWIRNFHDPKQKNWAKNHNLKSFWKSREDYCYVDNGFKWSKTPEGHDFWSDIEVKWYNETTTNLH